MKAVNFFCTLRQGCLIYLLLDIYESTAVYFMFRSNKKRT